MKPEVLELIKRTEILISNPNAKHNPYYQNRFSWISEQKKKIEEIKRKEGING